MITFLKNILTFDKVDSDFTHYPEKTIDNLIASYENGPNVLGNTEDDFLDGGVLNSKSETASHSITQLFKSGGCLFATIATLDTVNGRRLKEKMLNNIPVDFRISLTNENERSSLMKRNKLVTAKKVTKTNILGCTAFFPII